MKESNGNKEGFNKFVMNFMVLAILLAFVVSIATSCGGDEPEPSPPELTVDEIADNYALFFSVKHDRSDIEEGVFTLTPWEGNRFLLKSNSLPELKKTIIREESYIRRTITVKPKYEFESFSLGPTVSRSIWIEWKGKEIPIRVNIQVLALGSTVGKEAAHLIAGSGRSLLTWQLKVANYPRHRIQEGYNAQLSCKALNEIPITVYSLHRIYNLLEYAEELEQGLCGEIEKTLEGNSEYRELKEMARFGFFLAHQADAYYKIRFEAKQEAKLSMDPPEDYQFNPSEALNDVVFVLPVRVEAIDGIEMK